MHRRRDLLFFFFNDTATTEIYTLSLHDALPISCGKSCPAQKDCYESDDYRLRRRQCTLRRARLASSRGGIRADKFTRDEADRKSTRLNSSHQIISYAVFCLKKKKIVN